MLVSSQPIQDNVAATQPSSPEIVFNLLKCLVCFYVIYYVVSSIAFGAFELQGFDGRMPFDFIVWIDLTKCCTAYSMPQLANFISMETTYFLSAWVFVIFIGRRLWDYAITLTLFHVALSCLVMLSFPLNWSWWLCLGGGVLLMLTCGHLVTFYRWQVKRAQIGALETIP